MTPPDIGTSAENTHHEGDAMSANTDTYVDTWDNLTADLRDAGQDDWADRVTKLRDTNQ